MYHPSFNEAWLSTLNETMVSGSLVDVRGTRSYELLGHSIEFPMANAIFSIPDRALSYDFMFREAWWILSGQNRLDLLQSHAPSYSKFSDDGWRLSGAYGPKIIDQIRFIVETLREDPYSRQAVINIWRENPRPSRDIPCTLSIQFLIRDGYLHMVVNMRSSDVWLGLPYDVFTFTMLACQVGIELNTDLYLGQMFHHAGSRHTYFKDASKAKSVVTSASFNGYHEVEAIDLKKLSSYCLGNPNLFHQLLHDRSINKLEPNLYLPWM
jgi:thymidylate synthase